MTDKALVLLVHGFMAPAWTMMPLAKRLQRAGFRTELWGYASLFSSIRTHADTFRNHIDQLELHEPRVHVVAHSMGSLVVRLALKKSIPKNLGHVVLIAPPNRGSPFAKWGAPLFRPLRELRRGKQGITEEIPAPDGYQLGILAGSLDMLVPVASTQLDGCQWHRTLTASHNSLLVSSTAANLVTHFLREGSFPPV